MSGKLLLVTALLLLLTVFCRALPQALQQERRLSGHRLPWPGAEEEGRLVMPTDKSEWPELVGKNAEEAKAQLETETGFKVYLVETGSVVTMDFRTDRIRIWFEPDTGNIVRAPRIG